MVFSGRCRSGYWVSLLLVSSRVNGFTVNRHQVQTPTATRCKSPAFRNSAEVNQRVLLFVNQKYSKLSASGNRNDDNSFQNGGNLRAINWPAVIFLGFVSTLYWYWIVLAAAAVANDWPGATTLIPGGIPLVPGWPPSEHDLQPVIEDSYHFFYLSELLRNEAAPQVNPIRLAAFNIDEAWIFGYLIALWKDPKRLPRPALLGLWLLLGINLTNAFLAPYLLVTEFQSSRPLSGTGGSYREVPGKNQIVSTIFGGVSSVVIFYAFGQCVGAEPQAWGEFGNLIASDRTYLAFCVDLPLFAVFQPIILSRIKNEALGAIDYVPIVGLLNWMFSKEDEEDIP